MSLKKELASYVYRHDGTFGMSGTLMEVKGTVALRAGNDHLDHLDLKDILVMAYLCSVDSPSSLESIAYVTRKDESTLEGILDLLLEFGLVEENGNEYKSTPKANQLIIEVAKELIEFDEFKYKQGIQEIESLKNKLAE